jgi:Uma2 family endonuclease
MHSENIILQCIYSVEEYLRSTGVAMSAKAPNLTPYERLKQLPDNVVGEIIGGELYVSPRPAIAHARAASVLGGELEGPYDRGKGGPGGWWIFDEPELHLGKDVLVPDLAGWRRENLPQLPDEAFFELSPDWICEILSPSTQRLDRTRKLPVYARERVSHMWLISPDAQTLEVMRLDGDSYRVVGTYGGADVVRAEPFDAVELELAALWIRPPEPDLILSANKDGHKDD